MKNYDYSLKTTNGICFAKLRKLFAEFNVPYDTSIEVNECKIYKILYNEDDIDNCANKDEFLDLLEDLAIKYNL